MRCRPEQVDGRRAERGARRPSRRRSTIQPLSTTVPSATGVCRAKRRVAARPRRASSSTAGSSALTTAQSPGSWFSKMRALAAPYAATSGWRSRWSGEKFSITAIHGWNPSICSSWKLLVSTTCTVSGVDSDTCALSGAPMLPPTVTSESRRLEHPSGQRRRRRLALRAGDRDQAPLQPARRQFDFGDHGHALARARPRSTP